MQNRITKEQKTEYEEVFAYFDRDMDEAITMSEFTSALKCLGQNPTDSELKALIKEYCKRADGKVRKDEFLAMMIRIGKTAVSAEDLIRSFTFFDPRNTGFMPLNDLKHALRVIGDKLSNKEIEDMLKGAQVDRDGYVNYESLVRSLLA